ncbi:MAG: ABC transporter substrate-binding protein [Desulfobacterales bacterium]|jgi:branched-chain amino acid transport system substrate-binding protein|nr:ABC transporter substrate-binding protein [Desulfobacterales bacterium]
MKKPSWTLWLGLIALLMLTMAGSAAAKDLQIGALYPRSGSLALLGEESWRGAEIARLEANKKGGVDGAQVVFVNADGHEVASARAEAERLIEQSKLGLILGSYASSRSMAATEVAARKNAVYFELGAIANSITERGYQTVYRTCATAFNFSKSQSKFIAEWLAPQLKKKPSEVKVSIAHEDSDYGTSVADSFKNAAKEFGIQVVSVEPYAANTSDLSPVIFRLKKAAPDIIIAVSYAQDAILLSRQAAELKLGIPLFGTGGGHSLKSFQEALGDKVEGVLNVDFTQYEVSSAFTPGLKEFVALYQETFKEGPKSGHSLANYMGTKVLFDILAKTKGSMEPDTFRKAALAMDVPEGATSTGWGVKFGENGQNQRANPFIMQWRNGKLITVWPKAAALMDPVLPK